MILMAKKKNPEITGFNLRPVAILHGFILSQLLLLTISIGLALVVYFSHWQASPRLLIVLAHFGAFGGAMRAGIRCHSKAWLHGIAVGLLVFLVLSWVGNGGPLFITWMWWRGLLKMAFVAMLGGILGGLFKS